MASTDKIQEEESQKAAEAAADNKPQKSTTPPPPLPPPEQLHKKTTTSAIFFTGAFSVWFYVTLIVVLLTLLFSSLPSPHPPDLRSRFLSFPAHLRRHYSLGRQIKALAGTNRRQIQIFVVDDGPRGNTETVLLLHGLGASSFSFRNVLRSLSSAGLRAVAIDLPGAGFSDPLPADDRGNRLAGGVLGPLWDVYDKVKEKGLFWGFDQLVEHGGIPIEEMDFTKMAGSGRHSKNQGYEAAEIASVVGQVIDAMGLAPLHLVLHDSAAAAGVANWILENMESVRSVTFLDSNVGFAAFPSGILGVPVLGDIILKSQFAFWSLLKLCCSRTIDRSVAEAYRHLLKDKDGKRAVVTAGKALNFSIDLGEWAAISAVNKLPAQILWSGAWSDSWIEAAGRVSSALPQAKFHYHSGGRWPQEDASDEIASTVAQFVLALPKTIKPTSEEHVPEHIKEMFNDASDSFHSQDHGPNHHNHYHSHGHEEIPGFLSMYGLDHNG